MSPKAFLLFLLCFTNFYCLKGQENANNDLKVGLLLSGGGAKGLAHIGVLKEIEAAGVRIDYVAGTSIGAVIGGLYASGYSANEIEELILAADLQNLITDDYPRRSKSFHEKEDSERYVLTLPFYNYKFQFPSSISKGYNFYDQLVQLTAHVHHIDDFKKLPIPFFCMTTDLETGKPLLLESGFLPLAINASSALPTLFDPVQIDGSLYVDGGVANNYPLDELKEKGVDFIIGVDVQSPLGNRSSLLSASDILMQINQFSITKDITRKSALTDLYLKPNIEEFSIVSFKDSEKIIQKGLITGQKYRSNFEKIAALQAPIKTIKKKVKPIEEITLSGLSFYGNTKYGLSYLKGKMRLKPPGLVSFEKIQEGVNNLASTNNFSRFRYTLDKEEDAYRLKMTLEDRPYNTSVGFGIHYDNLYKTAALINVTQKQLLLDNDVASFDFILGDNLRYKFNYYIDKGFHWSIGFESLFNQFESPFNSEGSDSLGDSKYFYDSSIIKYFGFTNRFYIETLFREELAFGIGLEHKKLIIRSRATILESGGFEYFDDANYFNAYSFLKFDSRDHVYFPTKGFFFDGNLTLYLDDSTKRFTEKHKFFYTVKSDLGYTFSLNKLLSISFGASLGALVNEPNRYSFSFLLGGYGSQNINNSTPLIGYSALDIFGFSFLKTTVGMDFSLSKNHYLRLKGNIATVSDKPFDAHEWSEKRYSGYGVGYGINSFLGPIELTYSFSPETKSPLWYFNLGWSF